MKHYRKTLNELFVVLLATFAFSANSFAKDLEKGQTEVTVFAGVLSGIGTNSTVGVNANKALGDRFSAFGEFSYIPLGSQNIDVLGVQSDVNAKAFTLDIGGQYQFVRSAKKLHPYVGLGVGWLHSSSSSSVTNFSGLNFSGGSSENDAYVKVGGGARYYMNARWGFKPELMIYAGSSTFARLSGGIFYQFGE